MLQHVTSPSDVSHINVTETSDCDDEIQQFLAEMERRCSISGLQTKSPQIRRRSSTDKHQLSPRSGSSRSYSPHSLSPISFEFSSEQQRYKRNSRSSEGRTPSPLSYRGTPPTSPYRKTPPASPYRATPPTSPSIIRIPRDSIQPISGSISDLSEKHSSGMEEEEDDFSTRFVPRPRSKTCPENKAWRRKQKQKARPRPPTPPLPPQLF